SGLNRQLQLVQNEPENEDLDGTTNNNKHKSIKKAYASFIILLNDNRQNARIQAINMDLVNKLIDFFYPWKVVLTELQKTNEPSLFLVLPCITYLRNELASGERIEKSENMFIMEEEYIMAAFLHPNYKQLRGASSSQVVECYATSHQSIVHDQSSAEIILDNYEPQAKKAKIFMSTLMDKQRQQNGNGQDEVDRYISLTLGEDEQYSNPLYFWKKKDNQLAFPSLFQLAKRYFSIP
ncbi:unnamed protein product, partial [Rotaria magnacalcarata]